MRRGGGGPALRLKSPSVSLRLTLQKRKALAGGISGLAPKQAPSRAPNLAFNRAAADGAAAAAVGPLRINNGAGEDDEADPDGGPSARWEPGGHMLFVRSRRP